MIDKKEAFSMASLISSKIKRSGTSTKSLGDIKIGIKEIKSFGNENMPAFHMNWGWEGSNDGRFILKNLNSKGGKGYYKDKTMVYSINK